jgi:hypothetical protein
MTAAQTAALAATRTRDILILAFCLALAAASYVHGGSLPPRCAWTTLNHSGVEECHLAGPLPDPPGSFMAVDTSSHLEL